MTKGYLLDFNAFNKVLTSSCEDAIHFKNVFNVFKTHGWSVSLDENKELKISLNNRPISVQEAYEIFEQNPKFHEEIYHRTMDVWR